MPNLRAWELFGELAVALCAGFAALYFVCRRIDNYSFVDVAWSYAFSGVVLFYAAANRGWIGRRAVLAVMVIAWSARLGTHLLRRIIRHHPAEDRRYAELRPEWGARFARKMFGFFLLQAISILLLSVVFFLSTRDSEPAFHIVEWAGMALWLVAIVGEGSADATLAAFKRDPGRRRQVCDQGLWRYSRHPNYFFEWLIWVSLALFASASPRGWMGVLSPVVMLVLLLLVTGIPQAERQSLSSKGEAFRRYQRTTSAFVPWRPRQGGG
jgi:steroid 5-alpha reductase family enzyme